MTAETLVGTPGGGGGIPTFELQKLEGEADNGAKKNT